MSEQEKSQYKRQYKRQNHKYLYEDIYEDKEDYKYRNVDKHGDEETREILPYLAVIGMIGFYIYCMIYDI